MLNFWWLLFKTSYIMSKIYPLRGSFECNYLFNFTYHTMKFHNYWHKVTCPVANFRSLENHWSSGQKTSRKSRRDALIEMVLQIGEEFVKSEIDLPKLYSCFPDLVSTGSKFASIPCRSVEVRIYTDRSNENGTLNNKSYWNEGTLNVDKIH